MRASTLFGLTIAILIGMAVVFGVKTAGLFDKKPPVGPPPARPKVLVPTYSVFEGNTIMRLDEVTARDVDDSEMDEYLRNKHKYMPPVPQAAIFRILARNVEAQQPLLKSYFQDLRFPDSFESVLDPGKKAVNLEMPKERAAGGTLRKGDMVDVFLTTQVSDQYGVSQTISALIAPDLKVVMKRNSFFTTLQANEEGKPIPFTLQAGPYRAALIEFAKNRGYLTLTATGPTSSKKKIGVLSMGEDKEEEKRDFEVNQGKPITDRDLEDLFKLTPSVPMVKNRPGLTMIERWGGIIPRGGHTFLDREHGDVVAQAPIRNGGFTLPDGRTLGGFRFDVPAGANSSTARYERCDTCPGGKRLVQ